MAVDVMSIVINTGAHVFAALLSMLSMAALLALLYTGSKDKKLIRLLAVAVALFVWIVWFAVTPEYTVGYAYDKAVIKKYTETVAAHALGMETKEHIFFTGLWLATLLPIFAYTLDLESPLTRKLMMWTLVTLILGGILMEALGAWVGISAKLAWAFESFR